jgi:phage internal scaffolding protein
MSKQTFGTAYGSRNRVTTDPTGESLTQQHHVENVKVQNIIKQYDKTGILTHVQEGVAHYGDYSKINEYKTYLDFVNTANESFMGLPSGIRERFNNDPGEFFEFATNPKNKETMQELGLFAMDEKPQQESPKVSSPKETNDTPKEADSQKSSD